MPPKILRSLECNGRLPPPPAPLPSRHPTRPGGGTQGAALLCKMRGGQLLCLLLLAALATTTDAKKKKKKKKFKPMEGRTNPRAAPKIAPETQKLFEAIEDGKVDEATALVGQGADLTQVWETHPSCARAPCQPLHAAVVMGQAELVATLVEAGAPLEGRDAKKRTPLHLAAANGQHELVTQLLGLGAAVDPANSAGVTPLYLGAWSPLARSFSAPKPPHDSPASPVSSLTLCVSTLDSPASVPSPLG